MKKKILIFALIICVVTSAVYYRPMQAKAAMTSAGLTSAATAKVFLALLALAGVVVKSSDVEFIWDNGGLNVDAVVNNMMNYSRDLGMNFRNALELGAAGATTIILQRHIWNLFKAWARDKYGTDEDQETTLGTVRKDVVVVSAGTPMEVTYVAAGNLTGYNEAIGQFVIRFSTDVVVFYNYTFLNSSSTYPWKVDYYFFPTEYVDGSNINDFTVTSFTTSGFNQATDRWSLTTGGDAGYAYHVRVGMNDTMQFKTVEMDFKPYNVEDNVDGYQVASATMIQFRNNQLSETSDVTANPVTGVDGEAATTAGQDVVSLDTTATQEGSDVILEGPLAVALPDAATLEVLLKQLAEDEITYDEYVAALGLAAVKTKDTTVEDISEKEQAITVNPIAGTYTVALDDLFPFCIPFDIFDILSAFNASPVAPEVTISLPVGYDGQSFTWQDYTISLSPFDQVAQVARIFEYILFCIGLMLLTRKLIEG